MMRTDGVGLYLHIPFCKSKCKYCDFASFPNMSSWDMEAYTGRICEELESYRKEEKIGVDTVFFGGGTPTLLPTYLFRRIVNKLRDVFDVSCDAEFTVEANPKTVSDDALSVYSDCGVNRISIGLQSIHENELKKLGRIHTYGDFLQSFELIAKHGFKNISVDLMYGIPDQTVSSFDKTLTEVLKLPITHTSVYGLIVEEGTPFFDMRDSLNLPTLDDECDMYYLAARRLGEAGFTHYEISNYSKGEQYRCNHNLKYWRDEEYIGVGLAAYSYFGGIRYGNSRNLDEYNRSSEGEYTEREAIDTEGEMYEYAMLRLRLSEGFSLEDYKRRFGVDFLRGREDLVKRLVGAGYLTAEGDRLALTESGFYLSNSILAELL